ncbi:MAG: hypothetical protein AAFO82_22440 [Bacteroidota bacterium]
MDQQTSPKTIAIISYITIIGWIIALVLNNRDRSSLGNFHIRQALGIHLMFLVARMIPFVAGGAISTFLFFATLILFIIGILDAVGEKEKPLPFVGEKFQEWFKTV